MIERKNGLLYEEDARVGRISNPAIILGKRGGGRMRSRVLEGPESAGTTYQRLVSARYGCLEDRMWRALVNNALVRHWSASSLLGQPKQLVERVISRSGFVSRTAPQAYFYLAPLVGALGINETLFVCIGVTARAWGVILVRKEDEEQRLIYCISLGRREGETWSPLAGREVGMMGMSSRQLYTCFRAHLVTVLDDRPQGDVLEKSSLR